MRLVVLGVLTIGLGTLVLLALLAMVRELFCESILEAPSMTDKEALREHTIQSPSATSSALMD
jgi:hypothetical protein